MNCEDYQKNFSKLMDNELNQEDCAALFTHMGTCSDCRAFFRTSMNIKSILEEWRVPEPIPVIEWSAPAVGKSNTMPFHVLSVRQILNTKIPLSFAAAAMVLVFAGSLMVGSLWMRTTPPPSQPPTRVVYSYLLSPIEVVPTPTEQLNSKR